MPGPPLPPLFNLSQPRAVTSDARERTLDQLYALSIKLIGIKQMIDDLKSQSDPLRLEFRSLLAFLNERGVRIEDWVLFEKRGGSSKQIVAELLLEHGVTADIIAASTVSSSKEDYLEIRQDNKGKTK